MVNNIKRVANLHYPAELRGLLTFLEQAILRQYLIQNKITTGGVKNVG